MSGIPPVVCVPEQKRILRPMNAFFLYMQNRRSQDALVGSSTSKTSHRPQSIIVSNYSQEWNAEPTDSPIKLHFLALQNKLAQEHKEKYPEYTFNPRRKRTKAKSAVRKTTKTAGEAEVIESTQMPAYPVNQVSTVASFPQHLPGDMATGNQSWVSQQEQPENAVTDEDASEYRNSQAAGNYAKSVAYTSASIGTSANQFLEPFTGDSNYDYSMVFTPVQLTQEYSSFAGQTGTSQNFYPIYTPIMPNNHVTPRQGMQVGGYNNIGYGDPNEYLWTPQISGVQMSNNHFGTNWNLQTDEANNSEVLNQAYY